MIKRFFVTVLVILAAIATGVALAAIPRMDQIANLPQFRVEKEVPSPAAEGDSLGDSPSASEDPGYLLGEYNGRVSVLTPGTLEPEMIFDIFVKTLPDADQELLRQGIHVRTYEELTRLIEDYIS